MKEFLKPLIGYCVLPFSFITKRDPQKWCFGGVDNAKYMFLMSDFKKLGIRAIWYSNNRTEVEKYRALGYEAYTKFSLEGMKHLLTSKVYVVTHGIGDVNRWTCGNAKIVNLFHGLPYKKIGLDDPKHIMSWQYILTHPTSVRPFDLQLSTSPFIEEIFKRSFKVRDNRYVESMLPRNMILMKSKEEIEQFLKDTKDTTTLAAIEKLKQYDKVFIYMPTFRDSNRDFIDQAGFDFNMLQEVMEKQNALFIFKMHPFTHSPKLNEFPGSNNIMIIDKTVDVYPLLPFTTGLLTDYSSIYFDYILIGERRVIFYPFDYEEYKSKDRSFNFDESYMRGEYCYSFDDLLKLMATSPTEYVDQSEIKKIFWNNHRSINNITEAIIKLAK